MWNALKFLVFFSQDRTGKVAPDSAPGMSTSRGSPLVDSTATPARRPSRNAGSASASRKTSSMTSPTASGSLQGARVEAGGRRTEADPHWFRGLSHFKIGWNWIKRALQLGECILQEWVFPKHFRPAPAKASRKQHQALLLQRSQRFRLREDTWDCGYLL